MVPKPVKPSPTLYQYAKVMMLFELDTLLPSYKKFVPDDMMRTLKLLGKDVVVGIISKSTLAEQLKRLGDYELRALIGASHFYFSEGGRLKEMLHRFFHHAPPMKTGDDSKNPYWLRYLDESIVKVHFFRKGINISDEEVLFDRPAKVHWVSGWQETMQKSTELYVTASRRMFE